MHQHNVEGGVGDGAVEDDDRSFAKEGAGQARGAVGRGNGHETIDVALEHLFRLGIFSVGIFIGSGDEDRVSVFFGHRGYGVCAVGKERVVQIGDNQPDRPAFLTAKGACELVGPVVQLVNCGLDAEGGFFRDGHGSAEHA